MKKLVVPAVFALVAVAGCGGGEAEGKASAPAYQVVKEENRHITVEVDSTKDLRAVFDAVRGKYTEDGGYFVWIDCSTGGTEKVANRLATGKFSVGALGEAQTGLKPGASEFGVNDGAKCPAS